MTHVDFEIAKLLKEVGYNVPCKLYFSDSPNGFLTCIGKSDFNYNSTPDGYNRADLNTAADWIREVHGLHCVTIPTISFLRPVQYLGVYYVITDKLEHNILRDTNGCMIDFPTHAAALAAAITKACEIAKERIKAKQVQ